MHPSAEAIGLAPALAAGLVVATRGGAVSRPRIAAGALGVVLVFAAFVTELEPLANHTFLWAHLLQNVVLAEWAPVLLLLAIPPGLVARAAGFSLFRPFVALPLWLASSGGFAFYTSSFGSYNKTWGSLAAVIILLTWLWLAAVALLLGAELNAEVARYRARQPG